MRRAAFVVVAATAIGLLATPALGASGDWYSASAPLKLMSGSTLHGEAYGSFTNQDHSYAKNQTWRRDPLANGNGVFVNTGFSFEFNDTLSCPAALPCWNEQAWEQTARWSSSSWGGAYVHYPLDVDGIAAYGAFHFCEDISFHPDICTSDVKRNFTY
ncbi:hypothetical protein [Cellulomonas alba]|uniref:Secreted protein n=1 Tax=Cellulomonas alba TaxID=3053467 RepID=A0ABT7SJ97_9CELL|nr:hypothetical protein [Cellulomonas alba]MDM7856245.1 hypothetical protein [Cellulomonas alba]